MSFPFVIMFSTFFQTGLCIGQERVLKFGAPRLTEEEESSSHMPDHLRCDACQAIVFKLKTALEKSRKKLRESEILDTIDRVCSGSFEEYGLKQLDGESKLAGPGIQGTDTSGLVQMGGKWPSRFRELCSYYQGEIGEMNIYAAFERNPEALKYFICGRRRECLQEVQPKRESEHETTSFSDEL